MPATGYTSGDPTKVARAGDTMSGTLVLDDASPAASEQYVADHGGSGGGLPVLGVVFDVEQTYGAVPDGTTDNYTAFNNAHTAMLASPFGGTLFTRSAGVYRISATGRVTHFADGQYCVYPIPARLSDPTHPQLFLRWEGVGRAYVTRQYPGAGQTTALNTTSSVILIDYDSPFAWSSSFGHPSFIGAPDADKAGGGTNVHFSVRHLTFRQPNDPSLCGLNLETCATADIEDFAADVNVALDTSAEPTHATGVPLLLPKTGNAVNVRVHQYLAWGYYGGYPVTEHCDADSIETIACKISAFIRRSAFAHPAQIKWLSTEECPWGLAGLDPTRTSVNGGVVACPNWVVQILFWDVEDFDRSGTASWMYPGAAGALKAHVYDPNNVLKGWCHYMRVDSGANAGDFETAYVTGGSNFGMYQLSSRDTAVTRLSGGSPAPAAPPDTPTIGTATAGDASATVGFTPASTGEPASSYVATSTPGSHTGSGASSPITVSGLTNGTSYTFTVHATNALGSSGESAASNSVTPTAAGPTTYAADTFTRANSATTLGTSSGGQVWSALNGTWGIKSNAGYMAVDGTGSYNVAALDAGHGAVTYTLDLNPKHGPIDLGLAALVQDQDNLIFWDISGTADGTVNGMSTRLFHRSGGSFTGITSSANLTMTGGTTYALKMVVAATSITCFVNGVQIFASSGATGLESQTKFGLIMATAQNDAASVFDNLLITN